VSDVIPFPDDDPAAWDTVTIGKQDFPGVVEPDGSKGRKIETRSPRGGDGATLSDNGYEPAKFTITLKLATREEWALWCKIAPLIDPRRKGSLRTPFDVVHPVFADVNVTQIYVEKVYAVKRQPDGLLIKRLDVVEWFPAPTAAKATSSPATGASKIAAEGQKAFIGPPTPPAPSTTTIGP
jgi:hypothetical protein